MPRHKRQDSDCDSQAPWIDTVNFNSTDQPMFSPISATVSSPVLTRTGKANEQQRTAISRDNSIAAASTTLPPAPGSDDGPSTSETVMRFRGTRVKVKLTTTHISWKPVNHVGCCVNRQVLTKRVPFDEVLSAMALPKPATCCCPREHMFAIYTFSRKGPHAPNTWKPEEYVLSTASVEQVKEWVGLVNARLQLIRDRPRNLLVFINPFSGARLARFVFEREVLPIFQRARIVVNAVETTKQDHARDMLELMKADELAGYQGVVAVGGDGLFQEVVSGLLVRRARGCSAAHRIRVGHVPAGSTDAVACTMHGSRCASTAALHIALGDRLSLDSGRVESSDGSTRHFVCQAGYGFMGDVMRFSERLRFMGPSRYDVTGALQYLRLASYRVALSYREASSTTADVQQLCTAQCEVCRMAGILMEHAPSYQRNSNSVSGKLSSTSPRATAPATIGPMTGGGGSSNSGFRYAPPILTPIAHGRTPSGTTTVDATPLQPGTPASLGATPGWYGPADVDCGPGGGGSGPLCRTTSAQLSGPLSQLVTAGSFGAPSVHGQQGDTSAEAADVLGGAAAQQDTGYRAGSGSGVGGGAAGGDKGGPSTDSEGWTHVDGEFVSIMCVVTPCRSDKSRRGIVPNGHLSDGRMYLVLVSKCSHVAFLRFLIRLSTRGLTDRCLPFVRVIPITGLRLSPLLGGHSLGGCLWDAAAPESAWNVDGELLSDNNVHISVMRGALEVFARGPETTAATGCMGMHRQR